MEGRSFYLYIAILVSILLVGCNTANSTALDASKPNSLGGILNINLSLLLGPTYPIQVQGDAGSVYVPTVYENSEMEFTLILTNPLSQSGQKAEFVFYPSSPLISISGHDANGFYKDYFSYDEQKSGIYMLIDFAQDEDCIKQDYFIIAVDTVSNIPQWIRLHTTDEDKCTFVATNGGWGYSGSFANNYINNSLGGAVEAADAICASNIPAAMNVNSPTFKAMIVVSSAPNGAATRTLSTNWVFSAPYTAIRYFGRGGYTKIFDLAYQGTHPDFANENHLENSFGGAGTIWTGFSDSNWGIGTPSQTQCAGGAGQFAYSWYSASALTGSYGLLNEIYYQAIAKFSTTSTGLDLQSCNTSRYLLCVEQ
ncbi:DUF1554 domain-containing protein [Leptospira wolffii]|uniref:DUF1554 domain-containing protein n=1 Tax=Leptospira wolffii TaxID=409998 RepID=UPI000352E063|nr:DUF1554 domain-containing protein [Leptospira wolffii]EPG65067.1 PF07588 family protein [Leptospira wolffii serovar Khorat str. Khorat-H2]